MCVEYKEEKALSYMTPYALDLLRKLNKKSGLVFAPLTTRSSEQYERIRFFEDGPPEIALAANGGILYADGRFDAEWFEESKRMISGCQDEFTKGIEWLSKDKNVYFEIRVVDELFVFTKSSDPAGTRAGLEGILDSKKVCTWNTGDKVYIFPKILTKGKAVERLRKKLSPGLVISAGDSDFDISMLESADIALCPKDLMQYVSADKITGFDTAERNFAEQLLEYISDIAN